MKGRRCPNSHIRRKANVYTGQECCLSPVGLRKGGMAGDTPSQPGCRQTGHPSGRVSTGSTSIQSNMATAEDVFPFLFLSFFLSFFFFWLHHRHAKLRGPGIEPTSQPNHSSDNTRSLPHCATRELPAFPLLRIVLDKLPHIKGYSFSRVGRSERVETGVPVVA